VEESALRRLILFAAGLALATGVAVAADDALGASIPDSTASWNGMLHIRVACAAGGATCRGDLSIYDPADSVHSLTGASYKIAAGQTTSVTLDPSSHTSQRIASLDSIVAHLDAVDAHYEKTLKIVKPTAPKAKPLGPPTKRQVVKDRRDGNASCDIRQVSAKRSGRTVVFSVVNKTPLNQHDGSGIPITPQMEFPWPKSQGGSGRTPIQMGGDGSLRGYTMKFWPKVPISVNGRTVTWKVPLKYLSKRSFKWRAVCLDADHVRDAAPNRGYKTFIR
jgi:hypothetical protein